MRDPHIREVLIYRYRSCRCGHTFRHYPEGISQASQRKRYWKLLRVAGMDGAYVRGWGETQPVLVVVDLGTGQPVTVGYVDEKEPQAVKKFLAPLIQRLEKAAYHEFPKFTDQLWDKYTQI